MDGGGGVPADLWHHCVTRQQWRTSCARIRPITQLMLSPRYRPSALHSFVAVPQLLEITFNLKGQCHEIFDLGFFIKQSPLGPLFTGWSRLAHGFVFADQIDSKIVKIGSLGVNDTAGSDVFVRFIVTICMWCLLMYLFLLWSPRCPDLAVSMKPLNPIPLSHWDYRIFYKNVHVRTRGAYNTAGSLKRILFNFLQKKTATLPLIFVRFYLCHIFPWSSQWYFNGKITFYV
jgi:hypothetical protein